MKQHGLIDRVISAVVLDDGMDKGNYSPAESVPLVNNSDGVPATGSLNYIIIIGMMLYLSGRTHPYIYFAINCFSRYMFFAQAFACICFEENQWVFETDQESWIDIESQ